MFQYSASTGGFYTPEINGKNVPSDAVHVTLERHAELMTAQQNGAQIVAGNNGEPTAFVPVVAPTVQKEIELALHLQRLDKIAPRLEGIAGRAFRAGDESLSVACDAAVEGLLGISEYPSVKNALVLIEVQTALAERVAAIISNAPDSVAAVLRETFESKI